MCATSAYGMGVDCPDVREVIHFGVPSDKETYIKKLGGLDGTVCPHWPFLFPLIMTVLLQVVCVVIFLIVVKYEP